MTDQEKLRKIVEHAVEQEKDARKGYGNKRGAAATRAQNEATMFSWVRGVARADGRTVAAVAAAIELEKGALDGLLRRRPRGGKLIRLQGQRRALRVMREYVASL